MQRQHPVSITYQDQELGTAFRADLLVEDRVIVEIKSVESSRAIHHAQLLTYLRLANKPLGLLINFNTVLLKEGIKRIVNGLLEP